MPRVFIKHKSGSKAGQTDMLDFVNSREVVLGRDQACDLAYDENRDETVSRKHAKIVQNSSEPNVFMIENFSPNGTFVNDRKIDGPTPLSHGSTVRFGRSGPSFIFETDPPPSGGKLTVLDLGDGNAPPAEVKSEPWWVRRLTLTDATLAGSAQERRWSPAKILFYSTVVLLVLALAAGAFLFVTRPEDSASILRANAGAVVSIDATWRLFDVESGRQAYHWYVQSPVAESGDVRMPVFVRMADGAIEPVLILDDERDTNKPIGGQILGSGCVVHENGFILTSGPIAAPFTRPYDWSRESLPVLLIDPGDHTVSRMSEFPDGWVPSASRFVITRRTSIDDVRLGRVESTGHRLEGRLDAITIGFSGSENRLNAKLVAMSANQQMALIKVDPLRPVHSVPIKGNVTHLAAAERAFVIGYGLGSGDGRKVAVRLASVVKAADSASGQSGSCPGCYQISDSGTDAGFAGGPVFDERGRLAGVFLPDAGKQEKSFAVVPLEGASDLLGFSQK
jgi:S1-C subfamily serine protease